MIIKIKPIKWIIPKIPTFLRIIFLISGIFLEVLGLIWFYFPVYYDIFSILPIAAGIILIFLSSNWLVVRIGVFFLGFILILVFLIQFFTGNWAQNMMPSLILGLILIFFGGGAEVLQLIDNALTSI